MQTSLATRLFNALSLAVGAGGVSFSGPEYQWAFIWILCLSVLAAAAMVIREIYARHRVTQMFLPTLLIVGCAIGLIYGFVLATERWPYGARSPSSTATIKGPIPISTSLIETPDYRKQSGTADSPENDQPMLQTREAFITNVSTNKAVTISWSLIGVIPGQKGVLKLSGEGTDFYGRAVGGNRGWLAGRLKAAGLSVNYLLSPVTLKPQETVRGHLIFVLPFSFSDADDQFKKAHEQMLLDLINNKYELGLEIEDVISGKKSTLPLPGRYEGSPQ
jgi:hypothetical protein